MQPKPIVARPVIITSPPLITPPSVGKPVSVISPKPKDKDSINLYENIKKSYLDIPEPRESDFSTLVNNVFSGSIGNLAVGYYTFGLDRLNIISKATYNSMLAGNTLNFIEKGDYPIWANNTSFLKKIKNPTNVEKKLAQTAIGMTTVGDLYSISESDLRNMNGEAITARARVASTLIGADKNLSELQNLTRSIDLGLNILKVKDWILSVRSLSQDSQELLDDLIQINQDGKKLHKELVATSKEINALFSGRYDPNYLEKMAKIIQKNNSNKAIAKRLIETVNSPKKFKETLERIETVSAALEVINTYKKEQIELNDFLKNADHQDKVIYLTQLAILKANPNLDLRGQKIFDFRKKPLFGKYELYTKTIH